MVQINLRFFSIAGQIMVKILFNLNQLLNSKSRALLTMFVFRSKIQLYLGYLATQIKLRE